MLPWIRFDEYLPSPGDKIAVWDGKNIGFITVLPGDFGKDTPVFWEQFLVITPPAPKLRPAKEPT